jgi:phosphatidate cytidylyltransferase
LDCRSWIEEGKSTDGAINKESKIQNRKSMLKRTLTAALLIPPVLYLVGWSPQWLFLLALVAGVELGLSEFFALIRPMNYKVFPWCGYLAGAALCVAQAVPGDESRALAMPVLLVLVIPLLGLRSSIDLKDYLMGTAVTLFGVFYIGLTLSCLLPIRFSYSPLAGSRLSGQGAWGTPPGTCLLLLLFLTIWAGDICAYLVGRPWGRTPFFARISPRKTWEGALAGFVGSLLAAWIFAHWFWQTADIKTVILMSGWVAVAGQIGDLVESALKRGVNQKDSGTLLPGHGGFLDRIDSLLFGAPALWLALVVLGFPR